MRKDYAAAAKSHQSCPTLCDPTDESNHNKKNFRGRKNSENLFNSCQIILKSFLKAIFVKIKIMTKDNPHKIYLCYVEFQQVFLFLSTGQLEELSAEHLYMRHPLVQRQQTNNLTLKTSQPTLKDKRVFLTLFSSINTNNIH